MSMFDAAIRALLEKWSKAAREDAAAVLAEQRRTNQLLEALLRHVQAAGGVDAAVAARQPYGRPDPIPGVPPTVEARYAPPPPAERRPRWGRG